MFGKNGKIVMLAPRAMDVSASSRMLANMDSSRFISHGEMNGLVAAQGAEMDQVDDHLAEVETRLAVLESGRGFWGSVWKVAKWGLALGIASGVLARAIEAATGGDLEEIKEKVIDLSIDVRANERKIRSLGDRVGDLEEMAKTINAMTVEVESE